MMCTVGTIPKQHWSSKLHPMKIDKKWYNSESVACVAGISEAHGLELVKYYKRAIDRFDFIDYLTKLKEEVLEEKICIYFDQLGVHRAGLVKDKMREFGWRWLYNAAYYPDGNGIEYIFSQVKHRFKKMRISTIVNGR